MGYFTKSKFTLIEKELKNRKVILNDGRTVCIDTVDYEPADPSVGIMSGTAHVQTLCGMLLYVNDDGSIQDADADYDPTTKQQPVIANIGNWLPSQDSK